MNRLNFITTEAIGIKKISSNKDKEAPLIFRNNGWYVGNVRINNITNYDYMSKVLDPGGRILMEANIRIYFTVDENENFTPI